MSYTRNKNKLYILDNSPFFDKEELGFKSKLVPLQYNEKEDYYVAKKVIIKAQEFVKVIVERKFNITEYYNLSDLSKTLLMYIVVTKLERDNLTFHLDAKVFSTIVGHKSPQKTYDAINELIDKQYIARTTTDKLYWINHNKYYKGNYLIYKNVESNEIHNRSKKC